MDRIDPVPPLLTSTRPAPLELPAVPAARTHAEALLEKLRLPALQIVPKAVLEDAPDFIGMLRNDIAMLVDRGLTLDVLRPLSFAADAWWDLLPAEREARQAAHRATDERRRAEARARHAAGWARYDLTVAAIASIEHPVLRAVLAHHLPLLDDLDHYGHLECAGCDEGDGYDRGSIDWPCSTIRLAFEAEGLTDLLPTEPLPVRSAPADLKET